ncbi:MAG TPA: hypothetical protein PKI66_04680 [Methanobacteriaceae archaeon]|jgi:hypothetical protein|nr:hypothetical protein [Euryarchaeota archaeon]HNR25990.1 hypothetical protein [Methanobacteriaceae archaeon]HNS24781.1 hypothetical protein [Methanobacteriaceae archaeon]
MDCKVEVSNETGRNVCKFEDDKFEVTIVLKKDYSDVEVKLRTSKILKDIEEALEVVTRTDEFKDLVDSYGYLNIERIEG